MVTRLEDSSSSALLDATHVGLAGCLRGTLCVELCHALLQLLLVLLDQVGFDEVDWARDSECLDHSSVCLVESRRTVRQAFQDLNCLIRVISV